MTKIFLQSYKILEKVCDFFLTFVFVPEGYKEIIIMRWKVLKLLCFLLYWALDATARKNNGLQKPQLLILFVMLPA